MAFTAVNRVDPVATIYLAAGGSDPAVVLPVATGRCGRHCHRDPLAGGDSDLVRFGKTRRLWADFCCAQVSNLPGDGFSNLGKRRPFRSRARAALADCGSFDSTVAEYLGLYSDGIRAPKRFSS